MQLPWKCDACVASTCPAMALNATTVEVLRIWRAKKKDKCKTAMGITLRCCHRASLWSSELDISFSFVSTSDNLFQVLHPYFPVADTTLKSLHTLWETDILQLCSEGELSQPSPSNTCCSHHSSSLQDGGCFWLCLLSTSAVPDN